MAICDYIDFAYELEKDFYEWLNGEGFHKDYQEAAEAAAGSDIEPLFEYLDLPF